jgi:hypothetical protein
MSCDKLCSEWPSKSMMTFQIGNVAATCMSKFWVSYVCYCTHQCRTFSFAENILKEPCSDWRIDCCGNCKSQARSALNVLFTCSRYDLEIHRSTLNCYLIKYAY